MVFIGHGGKRPGAGRKLAPGKRRSVSHRTREHAFDKPLHITARLADDIPNVRKRDLYLLIEEAIREANDRFGFRVLEFSVQANHLHLLAEADFRFSLTRGMQGLQIRIAKAINRHLGRRGKAFADRYHSRVLKTPTEVRNCLVYVLNNAKHHAADQGAQRVDPFSSAVWFAGWNRPVESPRKPAPPPTTSAETWLMLKGWRKLGLIAPTEVPREAKLRRAA
jgi:REP element-mobilizing transposase RayT